MVAFIVDDALRLRLLLREPQVMDELQLLLAGIGQRLDEHFARKSGSDTILIEVGGRQAWAANVVLAKRQCTEKRAVIRRAMLELDEVLDVAMTVGGGEFGP